VTRWVFTVVDLHLLLLVGLPTHYQATECLTRSRFLPVMAGHR